MYLSVRRAEWKWDSEVCLLVGPNGSGKTQLLDLVFSLLYAGWKSSHSIRKISGKQAFIEVLRDVFLLRSRKDKPIIKFFKELEW